MFTGAFQHEGRTKAYHYTTSTSVNSVIENESNCKTDLFRKVTNFLEKNACSLVYTGQ